jgi:hypothetical protein
MHVDKKAKIERNEYEESELTKVRVSVPYSTTVSYIVHVRNPGDMNEVSEALANRDPSNWESDPCFYEILGDSWKYMVNRIRKEDVEILEK